MKMPTECMIVNKANEDAVRRVISVTGMDNDPANLFIEGPEGCGKTALLKARFAEKDLLSTKKVSYYECRELPTALREGVSDVFLDWLGKVDVLLLDDAEGFLEDEEAGPLMCSLLFAERKSLGLDTVVTSRKPLSFFGGTGIGQALAGFERLTMGPLDAAGRVAFVSSLAEDYSTEASPALSPEAVEYVANGLGGSLDVVDRAVRYLMDGYRGEPGRELSREDVARALE